MRIVEQNNTIQAQNNAILALLNGGAPCAPAATFAVVASAMVAAAPAVAPAAAAPPAAVRTALSALSGAGSEKKTLSRTSPRRIFFASAWKAACRAMTKNVSTP
jgi:hypothetical protein